MSEGSNNFWFVDCIMYSFDCEFVDHVHCTHLLRLVDLKNPTFEPDIQQITHFIGSIVVLVLVTRGVCVLVSSTTLPPSRYCNFNTPKQRFQWSIKIFLYSKVTKYHLGYVIDFEIWNFRFRMISKFLKKLVQDLCIELHLNWWKISR